MANLLYIIGNPKDVDKAFSLRLGEGFLKAHQEKYPEDEVAVVTCP